MRQTCHESLNTVPGALVQPAHNNCRRKCERRCEDVPSYHSCSRRRTPADTKRRSLPCRTPLQQADAPWYQYAAREPHLTACTPASSYRKTTVLYARVPTPVLFKSHALRLDRTRHHWSTSFKPTRRSRVNSKLSQLLAMLGATFSRFGTIPL